jgi:putative ABC transport system permease protein
MQDIRDAFRALRATPVVTLVAVLSLGLGIGANTAIFSILDSLLLRSLPVREPERLTLMNRMTPEGVAIGSWTNPIWEQVRERQHLFDGALAWSSTRFNLSQGGQTEMIDGAWISGRYFDVLGVNAILGRTTTEADDRRGGGPDGPVTVISYSFWQRRFGGAADVIGKSMTIDRVPFTIVGVAPPEFFGADVGRTFDAAIPLGTEPLIRGRESGLDRRSMWWLNVMIRRKPGQSLDAATAALRGVQPQIREATLPQDWRPADLERYMSEQLTLTEAATGNSGLRRRYQRPLTTIMVVVALVLLIACANIANLLLARATARRHELSVRLALGASRARLARQLLAESLLLAGAGAAAGLLFAQWGSRLLVRQLSTPTSYVFLTLDLDWRVLAFTTAVAAATALLFGTAPAFRATRVAPIDALKEQGRGPAGEGRMGFGHTLVVVQVALSLILIVAAGLFVQTFSRLATLELGFDRERILVISTHTQGLRVEPAERPALYARIREELLAVPGVARAAASAVTPVGGASWTWRIDVPDRPDLGERDRIVYVNVVSPDFFATMGTALKAGRDIDARDTATSPRVAVVNEAFARKFMNGTNPVGRTILQSGGPKPQPPREIVGLAADAVYRSLRDPVPPTMYVPIPQVDEPPSFVSFTVRSASGSPALLTRPAVAAIGRVNGDLALTFRLLGEQVQASLIQERLVAMLSGFFGGLALLLAGLGLYGVMSYAVSRRRTEIGIRMALGAAPARVIRMVLGRVGMLVALGVVVGGAASLWASRFVGTLLYGMESRDPVTFAGGAAVLIGVGALAGWLPARRAARIDPARVLREG